MSGVFSDPRDLIALEASNRADFSVSFQVYDESDALVSLTGAQILLHIYRNGGSVASATTDAGTITIPSTGQFDVTIARATMAGLSAGLHDIGCTVKISGVTDQYFTGTIDIYEGHVPA